MKMLPLIAAAFLLPAAASAAAPREMADDVQEARLRAIVEKLVSFGTRHTLSSQTDSKRGIGASLKWTEEEFRRYSRACRGCLTIATPSQVVTGRRIPTPTKITNVLAIQRGTVDPNRVVIISGHIDSRGTDVMDFTKDAPGANDDGSGTAAVIERRGCCPGTISLHHRLCGALRRGAGPLRRQGPRRSCQGAGLGSARQFEQRHHRQQLRLRSRLRRAHVRVFSEGPRWQGREDLAARQRSLGGENDAPSRNLSRWVAELAAISASASMSARSGATTASAAAATTPSS
jgi:hypothetical protein